MRLTVDGATSVYNADNQLTASPGVGYSYDDDGNLISRTSSAGVTVYMYDLDGNLTGVTLPGGRVIGFAYDSDGTRVSRTDGATVTKYVYAGDDLVQELSATGQTQTWYNPGISQTTGSLTSYFQPDHLGSTVFLPSTDLLTSSFAYDAWGNRTAQTGSHSTPFGFVGAKGYYSDPDTSLMKLGARYYDPTIGRFITKDPAKDGSNWFVYAGNNPVNAVDPTGMAILPDHNRPVGITMTYHVATAKEAYPSNKTWDCSVGFNTKKPTFQDRLCATGYSLGAFAGGSVLPLSMSLFSHWLDRSGTPETIDVASLSFICPGIRSDIEQDFGACVAYARTLKPRAEKYRLLSNLFYSDTYGSGYDLFLTLGGFEAYAEAYVTVSAPNVVHGTYTWFLRDPYEFGGQPLGRLHETGLAHNFMIEGSYPVKF